MEQLPHKILHETSFPILKDIKTIPLEFTKQPVIDCPNSHKKWKQRLLHGIFRKQASLFTKEKDDLKISSHPDEIRASKRHKSKLTWKQRFLFCMSTQTDD